MKNEIIVNDNKYEFFFDENLNTWRIIENASLLNGFLLDIEINLDNIDGKIDWNNIRRFIDFFQGNKSMVTKNISQAKKTLHSLFSVIYIDTYDSEFLKNIEFNVSGIDFKGNCKTINCENEFEYDYFFFPQYSKDKYRDIGSFVWRASLRSYLLLGVNCDRI